MALEAEKPRSAVQEVLCRIISGEKTERQVRV